MSAAITRFAQKASRPPFVIQESVEVSELAALVVLTVPAGRVWRRCYRPTFGAIKTGQSWSSVMAPRYELRADRARWSSSLIGCLNAWLRISAERSICTAGYRAPTMT